MWTCDLAWPPFLISRNWLLVACHSRVRVIKSIRDFHKVIIIVIFLSVRQVRRDERKYYEDLLQYSKQHLMVSLIMTQVLNKLYLTTGRYQAKHCARWADWIKSGLERKSSPKPWLACFAFQMFFSFADIFYPTSLLTGYQLYKSDDRVSAD